jgi:hypothetical protein
MALRPFVLLSCSLFLSACEKERPAAGSAPAQPLVATPPQRAPADLVDTRVSVALHRGALGLSLEKPIPREAGTINGVEASITGYVRQVTDQFLVLSRDPRPSDPHEKDGSLLWIPHSSILTIRQQYPGSRDTVAEVEQPSSWRLGAVEGLMNLIGFNLQELPPGELQVWIERDGKKDLLDGAETHPGQEQWLYFGIDPYKREALMLAVVSEENRGSSAVFLPVSAPKIFTRAKIEPKHDWTKPTLLATESPGSGNGKLYAQLIPKSAR